jgi:hypothetical protein
MHKTKLLFILSLLSISITHAQLVNVNPDPNGEPWIAGGFKLPSESEMKQINLIPELSLPKEYKAKNLPFMIDNSFNQYFRPIFNQVGGCCAQASGIAYTFTYEMAFRKNVSANNSYNQYPTHFTYNFLNNGNGSNGSTYFEGWDIIKKAGCPNIADFGGIVPVNIMSWMNGYNKYFNSMHNKTIEYFRIKVYTPEGLQTLKNYLYDHLEGAAVGGVVNFSAGSDYTM